MSQKRLIVTIGLGEAVAQDIARWVTTTYKDVSHETTLLGIRTQIWFVGPGEVISQVAKTMREQGRSISTEPLT